jgi:hypothetical protein
LYVVLSPPERRTSDFLRGFFATAISTFHLF